MREVMMNKLLLVISFLVISIGGSYAQMYNMGNTSVTTCSGIFQSTLGFASNGSGYANNENFTMTFCPGTGGALIAMDFSTCVLGSGDVLTVYNGSSTTAPILGVYDATNPASGMVGAQLVTNPGGCLTYTFVSDNAGVGNGWSATISCNVPCQLFEMTIDSLYPDTANGGYIDVCPDDSARIQVLGNYFNNGLNYNQSDLTTTFKWFVDSVLTDSGSTFFFPPDSAGAFFIQVYATDTLGCLANYNLNFWVRVATEPSYENSFPAMDTICFGDTNVLNFGASSTAWGARDTTVSAPTTFLPDGLASNPGVYNNVLTFSKFPTGSTVATVSDIKKFWVNMEHSFIGDLSIKMTCPNGSSSILKNFPGGLGTWLGEACDNNNGATPGIGYLYEWKPNANSMINMVGHVNAGCTGCPIVTNPCGGGTGTTLPTGSYNSFQTLSNMVGCPLNGTWTLTIVDQWVGDNGFLFSWGVDFDSTLYPSNGTYYDPGIDSVWIDSTTVASAGNVTITSITNNTMSVVPLFDSSTYCYTVNVLDGFGCAHDTTICFFVRDICAPQCYNPSNPSWIVNQVSCQGNSDGSIIALPNPAEMPAPWTYVWTDASGVVLQTTVSSLTSDSLGGLIDGMYHVQIIDGNGCVSNWMNYVSTSPPMTIVVGMLGATSCKDTVCDGSGQGMVFGGSAPYSFLWSSGEVSSFADSLCVGLNNLVITDGKGCMDSVAFTTLEPDLIVANATGSILICVGNSTVLSSSATGGTAPYNYTWSNGDSVHSTTVSPTVDQSYTVVISDTNNCPSDSATVTVYVRPPLSVTFDRPDTLCPGDTVNLLVYPHGGDSIYSFNWEQGLGNTAGVKALVTTSQYYTVTLSDVCGSNVAIDSVRMQVGGYAPLKISTTPDDTICMGDQFYMFASGFGGDGKFHYSWDNGLPDQQTHIVVPTVATAYSVTVVDECLTPAGIATITVEVGNFDNFEAWVDTIENCDPGAFEFGFDTLNLLFTYSINFGSGMESVDPFQEIKRTFTEDGCHDISVKLVNQYGCESEKTYPCIFKVLPRPIAQFDFYSHNPDVINHYVDFWDESIGSETWTWYAHDTVLSTQEKFSAPFPEEGIHNVKLVVSNSHGCLDSTNTDLPVGNVTTYYYPTAFTPDGNGDNEVFRIFGEGVRADGYELLIYDRWGGLVFKSTSRDQGWNGKYMNVGDDLMNGIYMYQYTLKLHDGRQFGDVGNVTLLR